MLALYHTFFTNPIFFLITLFFLNASHFPVITLFFIPVTVGADEGESAGITIKNIESSKNLVLLGISGVLMSAELQASLTSIHTEPLSRFGKGALEPQLPFKMQQPTEETATHPFSIWGFANRSDFRDSFIISQQKGHSYTEVVGMDYK
jgi:hypothetical protein